MPNISDFETNHTPENRSIVPRASMDYVTDDTHEEIAELEAAGIDVKIVKIDLSGHYQLDDEKQELVDRAIAEYSEIPDFAVKLVEANPAVSGWLDMAKSMSPLALAFFYNTGNMERPSDGLSRQAILHGVIPIEGGKTATQLVRESKSKEDADNILARTNAFFDAGSLKEGVDAFGLSAHDIMAGSLDRIGDITRAKLAIEMVRSHILSRPEQYSEKGIVSASFASGAAEPMYWLLDQLRKDGLQIDTAHQVDLDPIALAAGYDRSGHYDLKGTIAMHSQDLVRTPADSYIEPGSVDILEAIGFIEYMSPVLAKMVLMNAASIVKPGGIIVFGNMLKSRPQQEWFDGLWPRLRQRSMTETIKVIESAGFSLDQVEIQLSEDGLYAMYALKIPFEIDTSQEAARGTITHGLGHAASPAFL